MGIAFLVAMVLIYILVVWLFGNFIVPAIIMAPIPLTLLGIIPGHWLLDAEFTATSMIGWIALAGIIVRNSILLVDYSIAQVHLGSSIEDAVILACKTRTRPIMITAFALVGGSSVIILDPIFQGMAISLLFGVLVSTILTLIVIPLGCISIGADRLIGAGSGGGDAPPIEPTNPNAGLPLWLRIWMAIMSVFLFIITIFQKILGIFKMIFYASRQKKPSPPPTQPATETETETETETDVVTTTSRRSKRNATDRSSVDLVSQYHEKKD